MMKSSVVKIKKAMSFMGRKQTGKPVVANFLPIRNIAGPTSNFLNSLIKAAEMEHNYHVFTNKAVRALSQFKWQTNVKYAFYWYMRLNTVFVFCLTLDVILVPYQLSEMKR